METTIALLVMVAIRQVQLQAVKLVFGILCSLFASGFHFEFDGSCSKRFIALPKKNFFFQLVAYFLES
jgi:hypothetical protein